MLSSSLIPSEVRSVGIVRLAPLCFGLAPIITFHYDTVRLPKQQCRVGPVGFKQLRDNGLHVTVVAFPRIVQNRSLWEGCSLAQFLKSFSKTHIRNCAQIQPCWRKNLRRTLTHHSFVGFCHRLGRALDEVFSECCHDNFSACAQCKMRPRGRVCSTITLLALFKNSRRLYWGPNLCGSSNVLFVFVWQCVMWVHFHHLLYLSPSLDGCFH